MSYSHDWLFLGLIFGMFILMIWSNRIAYRQGIWDGAFNHFLPVVRKEMMFYDKHRAKIIFESEGQSDLIDPNVSKQERT